jgi:hypothetical protein
MSNLHVQQLQPMAAVVVVMLCTCAVVDYLHPQSEFVSR